MTKCLAPLIHNRIADRCDGLPCQCMTRACLSEGALPAWGSNNESKGRTVGLWVTFTQESGLIPMLSQ